MRAQRPECDASRRECIFLSVAHFCESKFGSVGHKYLIETEAIRAAGLRQHFSLDSTCKYAIFDEFLALIEARVAAARDAGTLDLGVETVPVDHFEILYDRIGRTDPRSGATTHLLRIELARRLRPMRLERLLELRASRPDAVPMLNGRSGKVALRVKARSLMSEEGLPIARYELIRPVKREYLECDRLEETSWEAASDARFAEAWAAEVREAEAMLRREIVHLATGLLLPVWDKLPDEHVQVIRIAADDGRSLLGREVPAVCLGELGSKLGLQISLDLPPDELAATVLRTGKPLPFRGPEELDLKRSLVNGSQRLELAGFSASRLAWYKAQGCFTKPFATRPGCSCRWIRRRRCWSGWPPGVCESLRRAEA